MNVSTLFSRPVVDGICGRSRPSSWALLIAFAIAALALWPVAGHAQKVTATVGVGAVPRFAAVNPVTNKTYVVNSNSNTVTVIDGATNATTTVNTGNSPFAAAVNPATNKIYVPNFGSNTVTVIDGATNATATLKAGQTPFAVAVNPVTNKIYVTNQGDGLNPSTVTVIDGATNTDATTVTVGVGITPSDVAVNPVTNEVYVANSGSALTPGTTVTVIDGATNTTTTVIVGAGPLAVAVNPVTNKIYVANIGTVAIHGTVTVIDANVTPHTTTTVSDASATSPVAVAVNPFTNTIYVANQNSDNVTVINGATNSTSASIATTVNAGNGPVAVGVNAATNEIYVANSGTSSTAGTTVTVIDGVTNLASTLTVGATPGAVGVNPVTNKIYVPNRGNPISNSTVSVIDGATNAQAQPNTLTTTVTPLAITSLPPNTTKDPMQAFTFTATNTASPPVPPVTNLYFQFDAIDGPWSQAMLTGSPMPGVFTFTGKASGLPADQHTLFAFAVDGEEATSVMLASSPIIGKVTSYVFGEAGPLDFAIGVAPGGSNSATVTAGQTANYALQVTLKGFVSPNDQLMVTVSCTGAPTNATCSGPASAVTVTHAGPVAVAISASTKANGMVIPSAPSSRLRTPWNRLPALLVLTMLLVFLLQRRLKRREGYALARLAFAAPILLLATAIVVMNGCGGGGSSSPPPPVNNGTPPGTYTLTVTGTGTSGNLTHTEQLTLKVQ
jgi:YVTN family beta-propeller protein